MGGLAKASNGWHGPPSNMHHHGSPTPYTSTRARKGCCEAFGMQRKTSAVVTGRREGNVLANKIGAGVARVQTERRSYPVWGRKIGLLHDGLIQHLWSSSLEKGRDRDRQ